MLLEYLEKRKEKLQGTIVTAKLSLKGVNKEIEVCKEAIDNQTQVVRTDADRKDETMLKLTNQIVEAESLIGELKLENTQLKHDLSNAKMRVDDLEQKLELEKIKNENLNENLKYFKNSSGKDNIFDEFLKE